MLRNRHGAATSDGGGGCGAPGGPRAGKGEHKAVISYLLIIFWMKVKRWMENIIPVILVSKVKSC